MALSSQIDSPKGCLLSTLWTRTWSALTAWRTWERCLRLIGRLTTHSSILRIRRTRCRITVLSTRALKLIVLERHVLRSAFCYFLFYAIMRSLIDPGGEQIAVTVPKEFKKRATHDGILGLGWRTSTASLRIESRCGKRCMSRLADNTNILGHRCPRAHLEFCSPNHYCRTQTLCAWCNPSPELSTKLAHSFKLCTATELTILGRSEGDSSLQKDGNMREEPVACSSKHSIVSDSILGAVLAMKRWQKAARSLQQAGLAPQQRSA